MVIPNLIHSSPTFTASPTFLQIYKILVKIQTACIYQTLQSTTNSKFCLFLSLSQRPIWPFPQTMLRPFPNHASLPSPPSKSCQNPAIISIRVNQNSSVLPSLAMSHLKLQPLPSMPKRMNSKLYRDLILWVGLESSVESMSLKLLSLLSPNLRPHFMSLQSIKISRFEIPFHLDLFLYQ